MSLLDVKNLKVEFETADGVVSAVNNVNFSIDEGKILQSGSAKEVFENPSSAKVAEITNDPAMNINEGLIKDDNLILNQILNQILKINNNNINNVQNFIIVSNV